jgi:hypothetical protein
MGTAADKRAVIYPLQPATGWHVSETPAGYRSTFGTTRKPRTLVVLAGALEIGVGNGEARTFTPGDIIHATDTDGQGHTSTVHGPAPCRVLNILSEAD